MTLTRRGQEAGLLRHYSLSGYDEMFATAGEPRPHYAALFESLTQWGLPDLERLAECGFTAEESAALLWLRQWYQTGGSDRVVLVRHWEFLRRLVFSGRLDV